MSAKGSIALTRNSIAVVGTGTAFTSDLAVGGFIVVTTGNTAYTLGIKSIESDTALTLQIAYKGADATGLSFDYIPLSTLNLITSALAAQVNEALRANNLDRDNWQQIFSGTGNVTVKLPDGTQWTGPAWNGIATSIAGKADKSALGNAASRNVGTTAGTVAAGDDSRIANAVQNNDSRIVNALQKTGGEITGSIVQASAGAYRSNTASARYNAFGLTYIDTDRWTQIDIGVGTTIYNQVIAAPGSYMAVTIGIGDNGFHTFRHDGKIVTNAGNVQISASDKRIKNKSGVPQGDALERISKLAETSVQDYTWLKYQKDINDYRYKQPQRGFMAQDAYAVDPTYADRPQEGADTDMPKSGENIWGLNTNAILADAVLCIAELSKQIEKRDSALEDLQERLKALDGLDA